MSVLEILFYKFNEIFNSYAFACIACKHKIVEKCIFPTREKTAIVIRYSYIEKSVLHGMVECLVA